MDRRSLIAIVITFAILIGWQMLYVAPRQREAAERRRLAQQEQAVADSLADLESAGQQHDEERESQPSSGQAETGEQQTQADRGREPAAIDSAIRPRAGEAAVSMTVDTGPLRVVLSGKGAELTPAELTRFKRHDGADVQLVPVGSEGALAIGIEQNGRWSDLSGVVFDANVDGREAVDGESVRLGPEKPTAEVVFTWRSDDGAFVEKRYLFTSGSYEVGLDIRIGREGVLRDTGAYSLSWRCGLPVNETNPQTDERAFASLGRVGGETFTKPLGKFGKTDRIDEEGVILWAGARSKYFLSAVLTGTQRSGTLAMLGDREQKGSVGWSVEYPFRGDPRLVEDGYRIYLGPLDMDLLKAYGVGLERTIDLGRMMRIFSVMILNVMVWMKRWIPNYGVIIIIISILTKVLFYRLTHKSFKSMKDMQRLQPKIKEIQEKYKDNRNKLNEETMKAYKEAGVNPLGGCLPLLLQMPVFIALFNVLRNTIELRGAPFVGWISDLSQPDTLFGFGVKLPFLGSDFHLLPILMGVAMYVQSKTTGSPTGDATGAAQTQMMSTMMPIVFTVLFYGMPSGLVLYWLVNNIFSIAQQWIVHRQVEAENVAAETA